MGDFCRKCGHRIFYSSYPMIECPRCGSIVNADDRVEIKSDVILEDNLDWILYTSRKATKKQITEGLNESDGRVYTYWNTKTGKVHHRLSEVMTERGYRLYPKGKRESYSAIFVRYDDIIGKMVFILASLEKEDESDMSEYPTMKWHEVYRKYIGKDKMVYSELWDYKSPCECSKREYDERHHGWKHFFPGFYLPEKYTEKGGRHQFSICKFPFINEVDEENYSNFITELKKFFGTDDMIVNITGNRNLHINSPAAFSVYLKATKPKNTKKSGPKQQKIDELTRFKLDAVSEIPENLLDRETKLLLKSLYESNVDRFAVIERVDGPKDDTCVLRTFSCIPETKKIVEGYRMYIQKKNVYVAMFTDNGWIYKPFLSNSADWIFMVSEFNKDVAKGTMLEYFSGIIEEFEPEHRSLAIWAFIKYPIFERLYKTGCVNIVKFIISASKDKNPQDILNILFLTQSENKNLYKKLGVNKHQLEKMEKDASSIYYTFIKGGTTSSNISSIIALIKFIMAELNEENEKERQFSVYYHNHIYTYCGTWGVGRMLKKAPFMSIAGMDDKSFDMIWDFMKELLADNEIEPDYDDFFSKITKQDWRDLSKRSNSIYLAVSAFSRINRMYGLPTLLSVIPNYIKHVYKCQTIETTPYGNATVHDIARFYDDYLDLVKHLEDTQNFRPQIHSSDQVIEMHNIASEIFQMKKQEVEMKKWDEEVKKCKKWEYSDNDYSVISPKIPEDLAREGNALSHCVKMYISRVTSGTTNIMFIRKNSKLDEPFFTVEIGNMGIVEQIHGFGNRNLDTEPDLIPFVNKWIKERSLRENGFNKVR